MRLGGSAFMNSRDLFGVIVRAFGLVFLYIAIDTLWAIAENVSIDFSFDRIQWGYTLKAFMALCLAALFFRKADWLVRFVYPRREGQKDVRPVQNG